MDSDSYLGLSRWQILRGPISGVLATFVGFESPCSYGIFRGSIDHRNRQSDCGQLLFQILAYLIYHGKQDGKLDP